MVINRPPKQRILAASRLWWYLILVKSILSSWKEGSRVRARASATPHMFFGMFAPRHRYATATATVAGWNGICNYHNLSRRFLLLETGQGTETEIRHQFDGDIRALISLVIRYFGHRSGRFLGPTRRRERWSWHFPIFVQYKQFDDAFKVTISGSFQETAFLAKYYAPHLYSELPVFISFLVRKLNLERISTRNFLIKPLLTTAFPWIFDFIAFSKNPSCHVIFHFKRENGFVWVYSVFA